MELDPRRLRYLLAISRTGGVLAAADELKVTPSAVSQQLARLEHEVGRELVHRTPRGAVLTEAGRAVAEGAEEIERTLNGVQARLQHDGSGPSGTVRVGAFYSFLNAILVPELPAWRTRFPQLRFEVVESDRENLVQRLRSGRLDMVVIEFDAGERSSPLPSTMTETPLLDEPWKLVVPAGTLAAGDVVALERLSLPWLGVEASEASEHAVTRVRRALGRSGSTFHTYQETQTALTLVAAGEGVTLISALALVGANQTGVDALDVPGLGTRRVVLRGHERRRVPEAVRVARSLIHEAAVAFRFDSGSPRTRSS